MKSSPEGRRPKRRWLYLLGAVVVVLIAAVLAAPLALDPERYRSRIEELLEEQTGWEAELGEIDLSVLGGLALRISPASLRAPGDSSSIEIGTISLNARWMPLLHGELEITRIELREPRVRIVRETVEGGWVVPAMAMGNEQAPQSSAPTGGESGQAGEDKAANTGEKTPASEGTSPLRIGLLRIAKGSIVVDDRSGASPLTVGLEELDLDLHPETGAFDGEAALADQLGQLRVEGRLGEKTTIELEEVKTDLLARLLGEDVIHRGGTISGTVEALGSGSFSGKLTFHQLSLLAGARPLGSSSARWRAHGAGESWTLDELELDLAGLPVTGQGELTPALALTLKVEKAPIEALLGVSDAVVPLPFVVEGPGQITTTLELEQPPGGTLTYTATGTVSAAKLRAADMLPETQDLATHFAINRAGELRVGLDEGQAAGGLLRGQLTVAPVAPPGKLSFQGRLSGAILGGLLAPVVGPKAGSVAGATDLEASVTVDLTAEEITPTELGGAVDLRAKDLALAGWDLEGAIEKKISEKLAKLGALHKLLGGKTKDEKTNAPAKDTALLDSFAAQITLERLPWQLEKVQLRSGDVSAEGSGSFDPAAGTVELVLRAHFDAKKSAALVKRSASLKLLLDRQGRLSVPIEISGPFTGPSISVEIGELTKSESTRDAAKELLRGLLKKRKKKK